MCYFYSMNDLEYSGDQPVKGPRTGVRSLHHAHPLKLGHARPTGRSACRGYNNQTGCLELPVCTASLPLPYTSSSQFASPTKSSWRSLYVPRSLARPSRSPAGTSNPVSHNWLGSCHVDAGTGTRTSNLWEWEPLGLSGITIFHSNMPFIFLMRHLAKLCKGSTY